MADIEKELNDIKNAVYGREVRGSIHDGIKKINEEVENTTDRQDSVEAQFQSVLDETTGKDVISAPEITAARVGADNTNYPNLKERLDTEHNQLSSQLAQTNNNINDRSVNIMYPPPPYLSPAGDGVTDDTDIIQSISNYARDNNLSIFIPNYEYYIRGTVTFYTKVRSEGTFILNHANTGYAVIIASTKERNNLNPLSIGEIIGGSNKITGLPHSSVGGTLVIESNEVMIKRNNPTGEDYTKNDTFEIQDVDGTVSPPISETYNQKDQIHTIYYREKEDSFLYLDDLNFKFIGTGNGNREPLSINRSDVIVNRSKVINKTGYSTSKVIAVNHATNVEFNNCEGFNYGRVGYGISIGNASNIRINNCKYLGFSHGISGRHGKNVTINGGEYTDIDCHWGYDYKIKNAIVYGEILYSGKDISVISSKVYTPNRVVACRTDTPELYGKVIIEDIDVYKTDSSLERVDIYYMHASPNFDWGREIRTPDLLKEKDIRVHSNGASTRSITVGNNQFSANHKPIKETIFDNIVDIDDGQILFSYTNAKSESTLEPSKNPIIRIKNMKKPALTLWTPTTNVEGVLYDIHIENSEGVNLSLNPNIIGVLNINNSNLIRLHPGNYDRNHVGEINLRDCLITGIFRPVNYFKAFNCIFDVSEANNNDVLNALKLARGNVSTKDSLVWGVEEYTHPDFYRTA